MKRTRILAALFAVLVMIIMAISFLPQEQANEKQDVMKTILVAKLEIPAYTILTEEMLDYAEFPENSVPEQAVSSMEDAVGKTTLTAINEKEMLLNSHLLDTGDTAGGLALLLDDGMRAISMKVDAVTGVGNLLKVGNHVDVIVVYEELIERNNINEIRLESRYVSNMLLENIEVAALNTALFGAPLNAEGLPEYETVTLAVLPQDAVRLALAMHEGTVYLVQRPQNDEAYVETKPVRLTDFITE